MPHITSHVLPGTRQRAPSATVDLQDTYAASDDVEVSVNPLFRDRRSTAAEETKAAPPNVPRPPSVRFRLASDGTDRGRAGSEDTLNTDPGCPGLA